MQKKYAYIFFLVIFLALGFGIYFIKTGYFNFSDSRNNLADVDRNLTQEQKKIYTDRIAKAESEIVNLQFSGPEAAEKRISAHMYLGQQYYGLGLFKKAYEEYKKVLQINPKHEFALVGITVLYTEAKDFENARKILIEALDYNKTNPSLWIRLVELDQLQGYSLEEMEQNFKQALEATEGHVDIVVRFAQFKKGAGKYEEALNLWQQAIEKNPEGKLLYEPEIAQLKELIKQSKP